MKYTEETLNNWTKRSSDTEQSKIDNAVNMIKSAISSSSELNSRSIEIFAQGSYPNNTNIKLNSDVDINVMLTKPFFAKYPVGKTRADYGYIDGTYSYKEFKCDVYNALISKFGRDKIEVGNKSYKIRENSYHVEADIVPTLIYKNYSADNHTDSDNYIEGVKFFAEDLSSVINYPKLHISNGIDKNNSTQRRYKRLTRIFKRTRYKMLEDGECVSNNITSFLIESLIYNLPDSVFLDHATWTERVREAIVYLWNETKDGGEASSWREVSGELRIFSDAKKWNVNEVHTYLNHMWNYLEYGN